MPELDNGDKAILIELLRDTIERDRFPLSPKIKSLRAILAKLRPLTPRPEWLTAWQETRPHPRKERLAKRISQ